MCHISQPLMTLNFFLTDFIYFLSVYVCEFAMVCMRTSEYNLWESVLSKSCGSQGSNTSCQPCHQGGKHLYSLNRLTGLSLELLIVLPLPPRCLDPRYTTKDILPRLVCEVLWIKLGFCALLGKQSNLSTKPHPQA